MQTLIRLTHKCDIYVYKSCVMYYFDGDNECVFRGQLNKETAQKKNERT